MAISPRATLLPDSVHQWAALSTSSRAESIMMRAFGDALLRYGLLGDRLAEGDAREASPAHQLVGVPRASPSSSRARHADQTHAVVDAAGSERPLRDLEAPPSPSSMLEAGTRTFLQAMSM